MTKNEREPPLVKELNHQESIIKSGYQLLLYSSGVFVFYIIFGYTQEWLFSSEEFKKYGGYATLVQFLQYAIFAQLEHMVTSRSITIPTCKPPYRIFALIGFLTLTTIGCSNTSLGYLNYPTQAIFKSCKLIPVMIGAVLIQAKSYNGVEITSVFLMTIGLVCFILTDVKLSPNFDQTGVFLIITALIADACIGNVQEKTMRDYPDLKNTEILFYSYSIGFLYLLFGLTMADKLLEPFDFCQKNPSVYGLITLCSLSSYIGLQFVLGLLRKFGSLVTVIVTSLRKSVTITLSFLLFSKPFSVQYVWSGLIVLLGIFGNVYGKKYYTPKKKVVSEAESG